MITLDAATAKVATDLIRQAARNSFAVFQRRMQTVLRHEEYIDAVHLRVACHTLQQVADGKISLLGVSLPPRHYKSTLCTVLLPAYLLGLNPTEEIICCSYGFELTDLLSKRARDVMKSYEYQAIFPDTRLASKNPAFNELLTTKGGYRFGTSVAGPVTGIGARTVIADDLLKAQEADSQAARDAAFDWLQTSITRITKLKNGRIVVPMQRLNVDDPIGRLKGVPGWSFLEMPAEFRLKKTYETAPGKTVTFQPGQVLFPEEFDKPELAKIRSTILEAKYAAQYLQEPAPPGGHIFKLQLFKRFDYLENNKKNQYEALIASMDPGVSSNQDKDPCAISVWGVRGKDIYLLGVEKGLWTFSEQMQRLRKWRIACTAVLIERSHSGIMLVEELIKEDGPLNFIGFTPKLDKAVRAEAAAYFMEQGHIYLPHEMPWLEAFEAELAAFPHGVHDDQVDSMSQFFHLLKYGFPEWVKLTKYKPPHLQAKVSHLGKY